MGHSNNITLLSFLLDCSLPPNNSRLEQDLSQWYLLWRAISLPATQIATLLCAHEHRHVIS